MNLVGYGIIFCKEKSFFRILNYVLNLFIFLWILIIIVYKIIIFVWDNLFKIINIFYVYNNVNVKK